MSSFKRQAGLCAALALTAGTWLAGTTLAGGQYVQVNYPASAAADELQVAVTYTMWIPDGVPRLRGVIVHQHGAGTIERLRSIRP